VCVCVCARTYDALLLIQAPHDFGDVGKQAQLMPVRAISVVYCLCLYVCSPTMRVCVCESCL